jgi:hypothetical protein
MTAVQTNIKGLPEGVYFTEIGHSQQYPWVQVKRTAKTAVLCKVEVVRDPEWTAKMKFHPGGFSGNVSNQNEQTWIFDRIDKQHQIRIRLSPAGNGKRGKTRFIADRADYFYDYNF